MTTVEDIKHALGRLSSDDHQEVLSWLEQLVDSRHSGVREPQLAYPADDPPCMTLDEFLESTENDPLRYEFVNGVVRAMTGTSVAHGSIVGELFAIIHHHLRGGPCQAFTAGPDLHIRSKRDQIQYIPDILVACNPDEWSKNAICNPKLVVEILSPSTRHIDLREKSANYRRVASIDEYLVLEQSMCEVFVFRRAEGWRPQLYSGVDVVVELRSISLSIPLADIYRRALPAG